MPPLYLVIGTRFIESEAIVDIPTGNGKNGRSPVAFSGAYSNVMATKWSKKLLPSTLGSIWREIAGLERI